jgi:hypothetical protein
MAVGCLDKLGARVFFKKPATGAAPQTKALIILFCFF